jgi:hypothetical protein
MQGKYQHYKGGLYEVIGLAKQSETLEELVIYRDVKGSLWARPKEMFIGAVIVDGKEVPRFKYLG